MRTAIVVLCTVLTTTMGAAGSWTRATSPNFEVYSSAGERQAQDALRYFERVRIFFTSFLKLTPRSDVPVRLVLFDGENEFAPFRPNRTAGAFYQAGADRDYIVLKTFDRRLYPVVVHEYAHLLFRHAGALYPLWLNEGLADFFSTLDPDGDTMTIGNVPVSRIAFFVQDRTALMKLDRLFAVDQLSEDYRSPEHVGLFYFQSWALTHMMLTDDRYRPNVAEFLRIIATGAPSAETLERAFGRTIESIARDLDAYVTRADYAHLVVNLRLPPFKAPITVSHVDDFSAYLMKATLLGTMAGRDADARDAFEALAAVRPDDLSLIETRAFFELRRNRRNEAQRLLSRAVALDSRNPAVYREYATLAPARAEDLLARAVSLAPADLDLRIRQASWLLSHERGDEALTTLASVKTIPRESAFSVFQLMASAYLQVGRIREAKSASERVTEYAEPGEQIRQAQQLQAQVEEQLAALR